MNLNWVIGFLLLSGLLLQAGCSSLGKAFSSDPKTSSASISNPFQNHPKKSEIAQRMVLRTRTGDQTIELEMPENLQDSGDIILPLGRTQNVNGKGGGRQIASYNSFGNSLGSSLGGSSGGYSSNGFGSNSETGKSGLIDETYKNRSPSFTDRQYIHNRSQGDPELEQKQSEIKQTLNLKPTESSQPDSSLSYLGGVDHIKQLVRQDRIEAALLEADEMIKDYPTDSTLYKMRGTLLDRLGQTELALQSWNQSLRFDPQDAGLRRFLERKQGNIAKVGGR